MERSEEWLIAGVLCFIAGWIIPMGVILWAFAAFAFYKGMDSGSDEEEN